MDFICEFYYMSRTEGPQVACEGTLELGRGRGEQGRRAWMPLLFSALSGCLQLSCDYEEVWFCPCPREKQACLGDFRLASGSERCPGECKLNQS